VEGAKSCTGFCTPRTNFSELLSVIDTSWVRRIWEIRGLFGAPVVAPERKSIVEAMAGANRSYAWPTRSCVLAQSRLP